MSLLVIIFIATFISLLLVSLFIFIALKYFSNEKNRIEKLKLWAKENNFSFSREADLKKINSNFYFFKKGYLRRATNMMKGKKDGLSCIIFDYYYNTSGSAHHMHTVFIIKNNKSITSREKKFVFDSNGTTVLCYKKSGTIHSQDISATIDFISEKLK